MAESIPLEDGCISNRIEEKMIPLLLKKWYFLPIKEHVIELMIQKTDNYGKI